MATVDIQALPAEYRRLLELAQERFQVEILPLDELKGGRTGALLYLVSVAPVSGEAAAPAAAGSLAPEAGQPVRHLILKLDRIPQRAAPDEIEQHKRVLSLAPPEFARHHVAELAYEVKEGEQIAVFYAIAGQSLLQFRPLAAYSRQSQLETLFRTTDELLRQWNAPLVFDRGIHPQKLLERWLSYRLKPGGRIWDFLDKACRIDPEIPGFLIRGEAYPNPLAFGRDAALWGKARPIDVLTGCQHGDLNTHNILARFAPNGRDLDGYYLIDFALFKSGMPLLFDQRYLEMSYLFDEIDKAGLDPWVDLAAHYAREDTPDPQHVPVGLAGACAALNAGRRHFREWVDAAHASLCDDLWGQFWLAGTAAGLNFCNKRDVGDRERLAGMVFAAAHLKRFCTQFGVASPVEVKLLYDTARAREGTPPAGVKVEAGAPDRRGEVTSPLPAAPRALAPGQAGGERRIVTILFTDIVGSTAIAERLDAEEWREVVNGAHRRVSEAVARHEGTIAQLLGDGVLAFFGAPVAHEDDPVRAVRAALDIQAAVAAYARELAGRVDDFAMRIGIHTGEVVVGEVGSAEHAEYLAVGDAVNLAARLEGASERGQILVGPDTHRETAALFDYETLPPLKLKGKADPVAVYRVQGAKASAGWQRRGLTAHGLQSPLVGRAQEVAALNVCLGRLVKGQGGIIGITGEAGLGKSRLLAEVRAAHIGALWLEGHTLSFGQSISYWPFQEILRGYAGITDDDSEAEAWYKLERKVAALFPDATAEILPYLGSLLTLNVPEKYQSRVKYLDGEGLGKQIFRASWRFWERLAQREPVVLVFEDLHWMDESSFRLAEHLLPLVRKVPLLMIGLSRPGPESMAARLREKVLAEYAEEYTDLRLAPLSPGDSAQLVRNLLAIENLAPQTRDLLVRKAEGNPFYLEEVIRMLIETGVVERDAHSGQWRTTAQMETLAIPDTVRGVIMARVDRLDEQVKQVLRLASVIGRSFLYRVLRALDEADQELDRNLAELQAVELIREKQATPELEYIFRHALAQEATYESILLQKRRELHAQVGAVIETLFADRLEEFYGLLAYHYAKAEAWEKAHEYLMKAADQAGQMAADAEALNHYQQAMAAYTRVFGDKWEPFQRAQLERKMGEALYRRGEHAQALEYLERGMALLGHQLPVSRRDVRLGIVHEAVRQAGHRLLPGLFLREVNKPTPALEEVFRTGMPLSWILAVSDPARFLWLEFHSLNSYEQNGSNLRIAESFSTIGYVFDTTGLFWLAEHYHRLGVTLAEQTQHLLTIGVAYMCLMYHQFYMGDIDVALENGLRSAKASREGGDLHVWGCATEWTGRVLAYKSEFSCALERLREGVRIEQECGDRQVAGWLLVAESFVEQRMGYLDEAQAHLKQAIELLDAVPDYLVGIDGRGELGRCYLRQGQLSQALTVLEKCPGLIREKGLTGHHVTPARNGLAEAYLVAAEQAGEKEKGEWLRKAGRACQVALKQGKVFRPGLPEAQRLRGRYEWLRGHHSQATRWWQRGLRETEAVGLPYDEGMLYLEMGKRLGERAHLEKAAEIFAAIGAEYDLAKARGALERMKG